MGWTRDAITDTMAGMIQTPNTLPLLLDALGVGRPGPTGRRWSQASFAASVGLEAHALTPSRAGCRAQEDVRLACAWALSCLSGAIPVGWATAHEIRGLTLRILTARAAWRGDVASLDDLPAQLVEWGIPAAERVAEILMHEHGERLAEALLILGWDGVRDVVREVLA